MSFEDQAIKWRKVLEDYFFKAFKKVRVTNNHKVKKTEISVLLDKRKKIKNKTDLNEKDEEEIVKIEEKIAEMCQEGNRKKVMENFSDMDGADGNLVHQVVWKTKKKMFLR